MIGQTDKHRLQLYIYRIYCFTFIFSRKDECTKSRNSVHVHCIFCIQQSRRQFFYIYIYIYTLLVCLGVCLFVSMTNVKKDEQIGPKFLCGTSHIPMGRFIMIKISNISTKIFITCIMNCKFPI